MCDVEGCGGGSFKLEEKIDEKTKRKNDEYTSPDKSGGRDITQPHTSHCSVFCSHRTDLDRISADLAGASRIAQDIETCGPRKGDGLDPWEDDIRVDRAKLQAIAPRGTPEMGTDLRIRRRKRDKWHLSRFVAR